MPDWMWHPKLVKGAWIACAVYTALALLALLAQFKPPVQCPPERPAYDRATKTCTEVPPPPQFNPIAPR